METTTTNGTPTGTVGTDQILQGYVIQSFAEWMPDQVRVITTAEALAWLCDCFTTQAAGSFSVLEVEYFASGVSQIEGDYHTVAYRSIFHTVYVGNVNGYAARNTGKSTASLPELQAIQQLRAGFIIFNEGEKITGPIVEVLNFDAVEAVAVAVRPGLDSKLSVLRVRYHDANVSRRCGDHVFLHVTSVMRNGAHESLFTATK